ncbi:MAG: 2-hydroxychromene-2-carboxylate isomerase [Alphaproteobacteria bacterium]
MAKADWYFDFVSPFAYLQSEILRQPLGGLEIIYRPVLFAGLLKHWGHKGPAEMPGKRVYTYRFCRWWGEKHGIPFVMPPSHPFNPIAVLRLAIALGNDPAKVRDIFRFIWRDGKAVDGEQGWAELVERLGAEEAAARIAEPEIKGALRRNGEDAVAAGVFGVPSFVVDGEIFWGVEATDMLRDYLADPALFASKEMARISDLPTGAER